LVEIRCQFVVADFLNKNIVKAEIQRVVCYLFVGNDGGLKYKLLEVQGITLNYNSPDPAILSG
jgi:hypothetical protein